MAEITRGTTPTIRYVFKTIEVSRIRTALLTIKQDGVIKLERDLTTASVGENDLSWTLTQEETLSLDDESEAMLNWVTADGTRGVGKPLKIVFLDNHKQEVI